MPYDFSIYSDASFDPKTKRGVGAFLILTAQAKTIVDTDLKIQAKEIKAESVAALELMSVLWAIDSLKQQHPIQPSTQIAVYTDSQSIVNLKNRRPKLEDRNFHSRATGLPLTLADLYRKFFSISDTVSLSLIWLKGHSPTAQHQLEQAVFAKVDRAARHQLRSLLHSLKQAK